MVIRVFMDYRALNKAHMSASVRNGELFSIRWPKTAVKSLGYILSLRNELHAWLLQRLFVYVNARSQSLKPAEAIHGSCRPRTAFR